jgi:transcriptional regulator with XRE-family HTH domain
VPPYLRAKFERHRLRMSQQDVAERARPPLTQTLVSAIENGRVNPTNIELAALAEVLGVSDPAALLQPVRIVEEEGAARG